MGKRWTYYKANNSYSRSRNASLAEEEGRYPKTRAAQAMGVNLKIFNMAIQNGIISTDEWHHVGRYAAKVWYYDTKEITRKPRFQAFVKYLEVNRSTSRKSGKTMTRRDVTWRRDYVMNNDRAYGQTIEYHFDFSYVHKSSTPATNKEK